MPSSDGANTKAGTALQPLPQLAPSSIRHRVLAALRTAIVEGHLKPGQRLMEEHICAQMAVSRGPVREAMRELELEGLIISAPYKGAEVLDISDREVTQLLIPVRLILEEYGFRWAATTATDSDIAELTAIIERMAHAARLADVEGVVAADIDFHDTVLKISGQIHCLQIWRMLSPRIRAYFVRQRHTKPNLDAELQEHRMLLEDFKSRDVERIHARLRKHIHILVKGKVESPSAARNQAARKPPERITTRQASIRKTRRK
jgi:DNA-binding GntR family transcriptional regulator